MSKSRKGAGNPAPTQANEARRIGNKPRLVISISIDTDLLVKVDKACRHRHVSRSELTNQALSDFLEATQ